MIAFRDRKAARPGEYRFVVEVRGGGRRDDPPFFHGIARRQGRGSDGAILSNLVSNVPAVLVFKPFISTLTDPQHAWLTLAMSSSLAGNLTVLGSIANIIAIERSRRTVKISFLEYLKVGVPLTLLTLWIGVLILS